MIREFEMRSMAASDHEIWSATLLAIRMLECEGEPRSIARWSPRSQFSGGTFRSLPGLRRCSGTTLRQKNKCVCVWNRV